MKRLLNQSLALMRGAVALGGASLPVSSYAVESACAVVKIQMQQEVTLERQGFDANMTISNGLIAITLKVVG